MSKRTFLDSKLKVNLRLLMQGTLDPIMPDGCDVSHKLQVLKKS